MRLRSTLALTASMAIILASPIACAQEPAAPAEAPVAAPVAPADAPAVDPAATEAPAMNEDEMAAYLNSQQSISQGVTFTRSVDGKVVETQKKTVTYAPGDPVRGTESGQTPIEALKEQFDNDALTRKEAYEEAKLDFVVADLDRNREMSADEFLFLVKGWGDATVVKSGRARFVDLESHSEGADAEALHQEQARKKFEFMSGVAGSINRKDYIREVLVDFDGLDKNDDGLLAGDELMNFRAANRGEPLNHADGAPAKAE